MAQPSILFVTGKLAEPALRRCLDGLSKGAGFRPEVAVAPISVVALANIRWLNAHIQVPEGVARIVLPGLCSGSLEDFHRPAGCEVVRGPQDLRNLPDFFGQEPGRPPGYGQHDISILAEINDASSLPLPELLAQAGSLRADGADVIDLGCTPGSPRSDVGPAVKLLRDHGCRVSIDSFDPIEVERAVLAGAELVLSVNSTNLSACRTLGCEVVVIPDHPGSLDGLDESVEKLTAWGVPFRIDPILEPIGIGFAGSLARYLEVRKRYPLAEMLMGVGNLTELTDVDSAAVNVILLGFCQETGIRTVLTTQVINWCRSSVRELALARALVYHACRSRIPPKHLEPELVLLRDPRILRHGRKTLEELAAAIKDPGFRLFADEGMLHIMNHSIHLQGCDPFELFARILKEQAIDPSHAFYLGHEFCKAAMALTLGKNYVQDQPLHWGFLSLSDEAVQGTMHEGDRE